MGVRPGWSSTELLEFLKMRVMVLHVLTMVCLVKAQEVPKSIGLYASTDTGIQFWANSSAASTVSILGNAAILLGGLYLLSRSDEVLALKDQLLPSVSAASEASARPIAQMALDLQQGVKGLQGIPQQLRGVSVQQGIKNLQQLPAMQGVQGTLGRVEDLTEKQVQKMQALTKQRVNAMQALAQSEGVPFGLSSIANALPSSVSQVAKAGASMREKMRQNVLTMLRPLEKEATDKDEEIGETDEEPEQKDLNVELPFLAGPLPKDRAEGKEEMVDQLVPPNQREEEKAYATKRFEERFRKEDEELRAIIEAQLANFESFKIIEETEEDEDEANEINDDPQAPGSEISATTVEIVFGTTRTPDTTMMSAEEENQTEGDYEEIVETTEPPEAESRVVEMDFLKKMAKQALQRKYKKVKKPKQLIEEK